MSYGRGYDQLKDPGNIPPTYQYGRPGTASNTAPATDPIAAYGTQNTNSIQQQTAVSNQQSVAVYCEDDAIFHPSIEYLNMDFRVLFQEHESTKTISAFYTGLEYAYRYIKLSVYHLFVFCFGTLFVIFFGIGNGIFTFLIVWITLPGVKVFMAMVYATTPIITGPFRAIFAPMVDVQARIFRQIKVQANLSGPLPEYLLRQRSNV